MGLREYVRKRDFTLTPEPSGLGKKKGRPTSKLSFVIQKHAASRLHYDFRLELDGVLLSWAVPKGPSLDPSDKRLAVQVEDHPLEYGGFEGTIPQGQYGGGSVLVWDRGTWEPEKDPREGLRRGKLEFTLHGKKLQGSWALVRLHGRTSEEKNWLLFKRTDEHARVGYDITEERPESAKTGRLIESIGSRSKVWNSNRGAEESPGAASKTVKKKSVMPKRAKKAGGSGAKRTTKKTSSAATRRPVRAGSSRARATASRARR
jgi:bifunctional non-homologous end joining protein LigD